MDRIIFSLLVLYINESILYGQTNLVYNPSFEIMSACPNAPFQISLADGWYGASINNPAYLNICGINGLSPSPISLNHPYTKDGNGYIQLDVWGDYDFSPNPQLRQFAATRLLHPLSSEKNYYISFYTTANQFACANEAAPFISTMGVALCVDSPNQNNIYITRATIEHTGSYIGNPVWYHVCGFHRGSDEKFLSIGNFHDHQSTHVSPYRPCGSNYSVIYYVDLVEVYEYDPVPDTILLCPGSTARLGARFLDSATYSWSTGSSDSTIVVDRPGTYIVTTYIDQCQLSDTVRVIDPTDHIRDIPTDTVACLDQPLILATTMRGSYIWSDSSHADTIHIIQPGRYGLTVTDPCQVQGGSFDVTARPCDCHIYLPNAFSPNGDGINDTLQPFVTCDFEFRSIRFVVADRWGEVVYRQTDRDVETVRWDGTYQGQPLPPGVYVALFEYVYLQDGIAHSDMIRTSITLIR